MSTQLLELSSVGTNTDIIDGLFNRYRDGIGEMDFEVRLSMGCTAEAYVAIDTDDTIADADKKSAKRAIFQDAKDVLLRLGCGTFGVRLVPKALFNIVRPKASDKRSNKQTLHDMLHISASRFSNEVSEMESDAQDKATEAYIEAVETGSDKDVEKAVESARAQLGLLRKLRGWSNNFEANMAVIERACDVVATAGGEITDLEGITFTLPQWSYRMMTNKAITVQSIRLGDTGYAAAHKKAHSKAKAK